MISRKPQPVTIYRAFYNQDTYSQEHGETQTQVIVGTSCSDFSHTELSALRAKHGVQNIIVEEVLEYI